MSGFAKTVGKVAGIVAGIALIGTGIGAALGGTMILAGVASAATIASVAGAVGVIANTVGDLTAKPPVARGQVNQLIIGANNPQPYLIGRSYSGGVLVHDVGWGGTVDGVKNPYRFMAIVHSCCGPIQSLGMQADFAAVSFSGTAATGYFANYLYRDSQLGARPESNALAPQWSGTPDWGSAYKLSGHAAVGYSLKWAKDGSRFAGGQLPVFGEIADGVFVYDPRLDSTYPGGSGSCRLGNESTYVYSRDPALHSGIYGYGRYVNGVKVFGVDLGEAAVDWAQVVAWANVNDANGWTANGRIFEPGDKWDNLKKIAECGAGVPVLAGGELQFDFQAPRTSLYTVTRDDLADGPVTGKLGRGWRERINTLTARYRSEDHQWNFVQAAPVSEAAFVAADGEEKADERQWDLVTDVDQVTELAIYDLWQRREAGPFRISCKPHMRLFEPGDCLTLAEELGLAPPSWGDVKVVIRRRTIDPASGVVSFEMEQETDAKHAAALGTAGIAPPATSVPTTETLDQTVVVSQIPPSSGGSGQKLASTTSFGSVGGTGMVRIAGPLTVSLASGESLYATTPGGLNYVISGYATRSASAKWRWSPAGANTWTDIDSAEFGPPVDGSLGDVGNFDVTQTKSGLSPGDYDVELVAALDSAGFGAGFFGTAQVEAKV